MVLYKVFLSHFIAVNQAKKIILQSKSPFQGKAKEAVSKVPTIVILSLSKYTIFGKQICSIFR